MNYHLELKGPCLECFGFKLLLSYWDLWVFFSPGRQNYCFTKFGKYIIFCGKETGLWNRDAVMNVIKMKDNFGWRESISWGDLFISPRCFHADIWQLSRGSAIPHQRQSLSRPVSCPWQGPAPNTSEKNAFQSWWEITSSCDEFNTSPRHLLVDLGKKH